MMNANIIEGYVDKVYGYAIKHTFSRDEADELSQEILYTAVRELPKLKDEDRFEPWLWGIAANVTKTFRRRMVKARAIYSYDALEEMTYEEEFFDETEELYSSLRTKIAMLSSIYRDIIILYYYDGLSTKQISEKLKIPEGTVTWRLSEARRKIKKECTEMETSVLRPVKMKIDISGTGNYDGVNIPFPSAYISDALSQNILWNCYEEAHTVEELAKICGVPAYYIEDRIENLLKREAVIEQTKGKYLTNFVIYSDKYGIYCEEKAEKILMPIMDRMLEAIKNITEEAHEIDFYKAEKSRDDLLYLYGALAFNYAKKKYCMLPIPEMKVKYDGFRWEFFASVETGKHKRINISTLSSANLGSRGNYSHTFYCGFGSLPKRDMMYDYCINVCEDILMHGHSDDIDGVTYAIQNGDIERREDGELFVTIPAFTLEQKAKFENIADKYLAPLMDEYTALVKKFTEGYVKLFPKHLADTAKRNCKGKFFDLYSVIINYAQKTGAIKMPSKGYVCQVLEQFK